MVKNKRDGRRKSRDESFNRRVPKLGFYLIATDAKKTEVNYIQGFKQSIPENLQEKIIIKTLNDIPSDQLVDAVLEEASLYAQYAEKWIVLDRDRVPNFDKIIEYAQAKGVKAGWSNPCIEIWFRAHYGSMPICHESTKCWKEFKKIFEKETSIEYDKADKTIYKRLTETGDENKAFEIAEQRYNEYKNDNVTKPSQMLSATTLHNLIYEIKKKVDKES